MLTAGFVPKPHGSVIPKCLITYMLKHHKCQQYKELSAIKHIVSVRSSMSTGDFSISSFSPCQEHASDPSAPALGYLLLWRSHVEVPEQLPTTERHMQ